MAQSGGKKEMKITVELPDDTITGFVNFVHGNIYDGLVIGTIALDSENIKKGNATYKTCVKRKSEPEEAQNV